MQQGIKLEVAVYMITYNHGEYIKKAVDSIMMQQTNFNYKLFIGDDFSNDNTRTICEKLKNDNPNKVELFLHPKNIGASNNAIFTFQKCINSSAKYIAICEGDDYWTDPLKLQKQVDFLESNQDYNICFHDVDVFNQSKNKIESNSITRKVPETTDINDLAKGNYIHTPSVVMRNNFTLPKWFNKTSIGDWSLYMIVVKDKKIKKLDETMAIYRVHNDSIWSQKTNEFRIINTIKNYKLILSSINLQPKTKKILQTSIEDLENHLPKKSTFIEKIFNKIKKTYLVFKLF